MATVEVQSASTALPEETVPVNETNKETTKEDVVVAAVESVNTDEVKVKEDAEAAKSVVAVEVEEEKIEEKPEEEKPTEEKPVTEITGEDIVEKKKFPEVEEEVVLAVTTSEVEEEEEEGEDKKEEKGEEKAVVAEEEEEEGKKEEIKNEGEKKSEE